MATVELLDLIISAPDDKQLPISLYMDLSKAFDTLNHDILLDKLSYYGVEGPPYNGSAAIYPTDLCMWKLIIWNHQYEPLPLVYHNVPYWAHFFFWFTWTISRTQAISSNLCCLQTTPICSVPLNTHSQLIHQMLTSYWTTNWQISMNGWQ